LLRRAALAAAPLMCVALLGACDAGRAVVDEPTPPTCFSPAVRDPDFLAGTAWTASGNAVVETGSATFRTATFCDHGGIAQPLSTPPLACARALVLTLRYSLIDSDRLNFAVGVAGGWNAPLLSSASGSSRSLQVCLGARAFAGGDANLFLGGGPNPVLCPAQGGEGLSLELEHVSIDIDSVGLCPPPGTVRNASFEWGATGWSLARSGGTAAVDAGLGRDGSAAAHLHTDHFCENPSVSGTTSLPTRAMVPNPALRLWTKGTRNAVASVRIGPPLPAVSAGASYVPGTNEATWTSVCLPRWAQGTVQPLQLGLVDRHFTQRCEDVDTRDFLFDDLAFLSEPACADADLLDPGFEQVTLGRAVAPAWTLQTYDDYPGSGVTLAVDASAAHSGQVAAVFSASTPCPHASLANGVTIPLPEGDSGPALAFWYRAAAGTHTGLDVSMNALPAALVAPTARPQAWTRIKACLDPRLAGRPDLLRFSIVSQLGGTCADTFPPETFMIDDVELTTDASCPAR
jgi:hypothetical protein